MPDGSGLSSAASDCANPSAPFHLFFPTRIPSGVPFLLHGYFEVDAARTGFYRGSVERNERIAEALARLAAKALDSAAAAQATDLTALVNLMARAREPEDSLASTFRASLLKHLDNVAWVPLQLADDVHTRDRPCGSWWLRRR